MRAGFFPLALQEFNVISKLTRSPAGFQVWPMLQLVVVVGAVGYLLRGTPAIVRGGAMLGVLVTPSIAESFAVRVYPERNIVFFLALLAVLIERWDRAPSRGDLIGIVVCAQFLLYFKEPVFALLAALAIGRRLLLPRTREIASGHTRLEPAILALVVVFLVLFAVVQMGGPNIRYAQRWATPIGDTLMALLSGNPLLLVFGAVVVARVVLVLSGRARADALWDSLAVAALSYTAMIVVLGQGRPYLLAPVDLVALIYLARLAPVKPRARWPARAIAAAVGMIVAIQSISQTTRLLADRKGIIIAKAALADFLLESAISQDTVDLYFPYVNNYRLMELGAFLRHQGVYVERLDDTTGSRRGRQLVRLLAPLSFAKGNCESWRPVRCYESAAAPDEALVVVLPDDAVDRSRLTSEHASHGPRISATAPILVQRLRAVSVRTGVFTPRRARTHPSTATDQLIVLAPR